MLRFILNYHLVLGSHYLLNAYYFLKPLIPQGARFALRYCYAIPLRRAFAATWPINKGNCGVPAGWRGWPSGKQFAFVLSHDVEGVKGLARCRQLAELEMRIGVRSSFNFVPEGEYVPPEELRRFLTAEGFEVGVHDLHHDGTLYRSRDSFREGAKKINHYLKAWSAAGFRSGFMFHNLEWLQELDISYDASTFDHDPFEPQPDGVNTIFPFWVQRPDGSAFVELPYTLSQDSTTFLVLREKHNEIWKSKLDWIAAQGGMAFVIVHPDYMAFDDRSNASEYRASLYQDFLEYVNRHYRDTAWFALPRDVADYIRRELPLPQPSEPRAGIKASSA